MQGVFKCIDFGLAFSVEEDDLHQVIIIFIIINTVITIVPVIIIIFITMMGDLHQIQSSGYRAPEAAAWNKHKVPLVLTLNTWTI